ncbi:hypothetical protein PAXINDRAFT_16736 [Paxillus involutus ATCC 200175]|uniref:Uncharacterized protein n=1 Tax=Paxillus involutus ATCC 200175 TaxID=664439 RepID=A0A0C9TSS5_PAXIN|nr:hypothetical protein PAXINDRAFT_16736 [Paxillus involutus ATCC 200175]
MAEIPQLRADGRNWTEYREKLLRVAAQQKLDKLYDRTETLQGDAENWQQRNAIAKALIVETIPDSIFLRILHYESAHKFFEALKNLFEKDVATLELLQELRNNRSTQEATYGLESANDCVRRRSHVTDASRRDDEVKRKREPTSQRRVERRRGVGEEGRVSKGEKDDEQVAAASGVSLVNPTSSQGHLPRARVDTPQPHPTSTSPPSTPSMPVEQTAPTSRRPTRQRTQQELEEAARRYLARRKREDGEGSRRGVESRDRGSREAVDEDGEDVHIHHANVKPQQPQTVGQTAVDDEAADTTDPHANSAGPAVPVGTTNGLPNELNGGRDRERGRNIEEEDEKGRRASGSAAPSSNDDGGDEDVHHAYVVPKPATSAPYHVPPSPDERRPPSVPLEGEMTGKQSSGHANEAATHLEHPRQESSTTQPRWTPPDEKSSGEGRGTAMSHREAAGARDEVEVEGSEDETNVSSRVDDTDTSNGVDKGQSRRGEARDEATGDEERQKNRERGRTTQERRTAATNANDEDDAPPPQPPPIPTPPVPPPAPSTPPPYPERRHVDVDHLKSSKMAAQTRANTLHDPGGQTNSPGSKPPSVRLEGERIRLTSLYVEVDDVKTNDHDTQQSPRRPVGTPDGDTRRPNGPTEPPNEGKGADGGYGEQEVESTVGHVETNEPGRVENVETKESRRGDKLRGREDKGEESRQVDEPGDEGNEESRSREVEGKEGGQSEGDACQRDGRTNDTGDAMSSASCNSSRVETGVLAEHKDADDLPTRSTHHVVADDSSQQHLRTSAEPERTEYAPRQNGRVDDHPDQPDATEAAQGYWGSVPEPPQSRTKGTETRTSTPHTVDITHTRKLPYRVITPA